MAKPKRARPGRGVRIFQMWNNGVCIEVHFTAHDVFVAMNTGRGDDGIPVRGIGIHLGEHGAHELGEKLLTWVNNHPERLAARQWTEEAIDFAAMPAEGEA